MSPTRLVVVGAAGTGRETLDIVEAINAEERRFEVLGVLDDYPSSLHLGRLAARGASYLGTTEEWLATEPPPTAFVIAIAAPNVRATLAIALQARGHYPATLIHPGAFVGSQVHLGRGTIVYAGAQISTNVTVGAHGILNMNTCIGHDCKIGDYVSVNPGATISGEVTLNDRVLIGGRATVLQSLSVGTNSLVGAAALVTKDVPSNATVKGVPGRWTAST